MRTRKAAGQNSQRVTIRTLRERDLPAAKRLCGRVFPEARARLGLLQQCASRSKGAANSLALVATAADRLVGIVCCEVVDRGALTKPGVPIAHLDLIAVASRSRRRGIAARLWQRMQGKLRRMGVSAAWTRSRALGSGVELMKFPEAVVLLLNLGFEKRQDIYDMEAQLDELDCDTSRAEAGLRRAGIEVKRIEYRERKALERFLSRLFPNWLPTVGAVKPDEPQRVHVARRKRAVIGFAASHGEGFGPIGVDPRYRFQGIGRILLLRCLRDIRERGHRVAFIGWANFPFYAKSINAPITRVMWQMEKKLREEA